MRGMCTLSVDCGDVEVSLLASCGDVALVSQQKGDVI